MDFIKTQLQLSGEGTRTGARPSALSVATRTIAEHGFFRLYVGYSAALLRQVVYGSARLGLFRVFSDELRIINAGAPLPLWQKLSAGLASGALSSFIGNPFDLSLVRMQADSVLPPAERRNYGNVGAALSRIVREEGVLALWRGSSPTIARAMALNSSMLATSDQAKEALGPYLGGETALPTLLLSSLLSGITASVASLPFDMVKTRLQKMRPGPDGVMPYAGFIDCARKIAVTEGPLAFYKGLGTYVFRIAPHAFITLTVLDAVNNAINAARAAAAPGLDKSR